MKKLMIAAAIVCAAAMSQAASYVWKATGGSMYNSSGTAAADSTTKFTGTAYIFDAGAIAQSALFDAYAANQSYDFAGNSAAQLAVSAGSFVTASGANQFNYGTEESGLKKFSFYFVLVEGDNIYFSNQINDKDVYAPPAAQTVAFGGQSNGSSTFSNKAPADGFQGAGKWSAVPEPTSGLLLLLGVAGLALRRRRD